MPRRNEDYVQRVIGNHTSDYATNTNISNDNCMYLKGGKKGSN